ncbi:MAG: hypothetical protein GXY83_25875 [Rhodopirellula sp.]|nr:hypothetical protein [Rhodopirellula sp.]
MFRLLRCQCRRFNSILAAHIDDSGVYHPPQIVGEHPEFRLNQLLQVAPHVSKVFLIGIGIGLLVLPHELVEALLSDFGSITGDIPRTPRSVQKALSLFQSFAHTNKITGKFQNPLGNLGPCGWLIALPSILAFLSFHFDAITTISFVLAAILAKTNFILPGWGDGW